MIQTEKALRAMRIFGPSWKVGDHNPQEHMKASLWGDEGYAVCPGVLAGALEDCLTCAKWGQILRRVKNSLEIIHDALLASTEGCTLSWWEVADTESRWLCISLEKQKDKALHNERLTRAAIDLHAWIGEQREAVAAESRPILVSSAYAGIGDT